MGNKREENEDLCVFCSSCFGNMFHVRGRYVFIQVFKLHCAQGDDEKAIHKISLCTMVCPLCGEG
jgi:ferredoxin